MLSENPRAWAAAFIALVFGCVVVTSVLSLWATRRQRQIREEEAGRQTADAPRPGGVKDEEGATFEYRSKIILLGWPLVHIRFARHGGLEGPPATGWIAA